MIRHQDALAVSLGVSAAIGDQSLPKSWFEANVGLDEEAVIDSAMWKVNTARRDARAMKRRGF